MKKSWDEREKQGKRDLLRQQLPADMDRISFTEIQEQENLRQIHRVIEERRRNMRFHGKRMVIAVAAAMMVTGTITAIGAGKIVGLYSSTDLRKAVHSAAELKQQAVSILGDELVLEEKLADGTSFDEGQIVEVQGVDEGMNKVSSYQELTARYGDITLSVMRKEDQIPADEGENKAADYQETVGEICFTGTENNYLFLPPEAKPSKEDEALAEAGELFISYGTEKEERMVFRNISWEEDGLCYMMLTDREMSLSELGDLAKAYAEVK